MQGVRVPNCREIFLGFCRQFIPQSQFAQFVTTFWNPLRKSRVKLARSVIIPSLFSQNSTFLREKRFILFCHFLTYIYGTWIEYVVKSCIHCKVREAPFWNVLFPYRNCPNSFRPPFVKRTLWGTFFGPVTPPKRRNFPFGHGKKVLQAIWASINTPLPLTGFWNAFSQDSKVMVTASDSS